MVALPRVSMIRSVALAAFLVFASLYPARSQAPLRVATRIVPPFVMKDNDRLTGFSVDLWQAISDQLKAPYQWVETGTVKDLLAALKSGKADAGIAAISITAERDAQFDFSQPMFDSGLQILARKKAGGSPFRSLFATLFSRDTLGVLGVMALIMLIPAHIVWLL